jgi:hypothetical protein
MSISENEITRKWPPNPECAPAPRGDLIVISQPPMRTAQNYMRMAKYEPQLHQLLTNKNAGRSYLTMSEALKFIGTLSDKKKRKARAS